MIDFFPGFLYHRCRNTARCAPAEEEIFLPAFDFDRIVDRRNTNSLKYDFAEAHGYPADVLPLWLADMDFPAPPAALEALRRAVDHGIFGYSDSREGYFRAVSGWFARRFGWQVQPEWLVKTPGVVCALAAAVRALTGPGDAVLVQPPVYGPFYSVVRESGRTLVESPLRYENRRYTVDFEDFEQKIVENRVKLFILCSPHNPTGRVWTLGELQTMGDICRRHDVYVVSDEIHCDFAFPEHRHHIFAAAAPDLADRAVVCTAPSKTFNLAGLQTSNIWVPGAETRDRFVRELERTFCDGINGLGLAACQAAYEGGEAWLDACKDYMRGNLDFLRAFLAERLPKIHLVEPEGTYFAWLDCTDLGLEPEALNDAMIHRAKLWLDAGGIFGDCAAQFQRVVLACPRATLEQALERLASAFA